MAKTTLQCPECCNDSTISTRSKEPVQYCPLCGAGVVIDDRDADEDDEEDDED